MSSKNNTKKKLSKNIIITVLLLIGLCAATFALSIASVTKENHLFHTGSISINLNDGKPIINQDEFLFEPGMTVRKDFFIENNSTWEVYYKIYFDDVSGDLADVLQITVMDGEKLLYSGTANELNRISTGKADSILKVNERKDLTIYFHYPENSGNDSQASTLEFRLYADAVQTKNNPNGLFY